MGVAADRTLSHFSDLAGLASRLLGGVVVDANDELFAEKPNLNLPGRPRHDAAFGHRAKINDGWETRRRRHRGTSRRPRRGTGMPRAAQINRLGAPAWPRTEIALAVQIGGYRISRDRAAITVCDDGPA